MVHVTSFRSRSDSTKSSGAGGSRRSFRASSSDRTAPSFGDVKITQSEERHHRVTSSSPFSHDAPSSYSRYPRSRSVESSRRFGDYSAASDTSGYQSSVTRTTSRKQQHPLGEGHDDLYVVGYATVKTHTRPAGSEGVNYQAFVTPVQRPATGGGRTSRLTQYISSRYTPTRDEVPTALAYVPREIPGYRGSLSSSIGHLPSVGEGLSYKYKSLSSHAQPPQTDHHRYRPTTLSTSYTPSLSVSRESVRSSSSYARGLTPDVVSSSHHHRSWSLPHLPQVVLPPSSSYISSASTTPTRLTPLSPVRHTWSLYDLDSRPSVHPLSHYSGFSLRPDSSDDIEERVRLVKARAFRPTLDHSSLERDIDARVGYRSPHYYHHHQQVPDVVYTSRSREDYGLPSDTLPRVQLPPASHHGAIQSDGYPGADVSVVILPSGQKAVTYTRCSQTGYGDQGAANAEIDRIIKKTRYLQDSMNTLEEFVRRNRRLFPEDIIIYQQVKYYRLDPEELQRIGERPDAEVYGVKIREKLVVPYGTEILDVLKRNYSKHRDVELEYDDPGRIKLRAQLAEQSQDLTKDAIRKIVEAEYDQQDRAARQPRYQQAPPHHPSLSERISYEPIQLQPIREARNQDLLNSEYLTGGTRNKEPRPSTADSEASWQPPQFSSRLRPRKIVEGNSVRLSCAITSAPDATVTWYHGDRPITSGGKYNTSVSTLCFIIYIIPLYANDMQTHEITVT